MKTIECKEIAAMHCRHNSYDAPFHEAKNWKRESKKNEAGAIVRKFSCLANGVVMLATIRELSHGYSVTIIRDREREREVAPPQPPQDRFSILDV